MTHQSLPSIVTCQWLKDHIDDPGLVVVDVTTYLTVAGASTGHFHAGPYQGGEVHAAGAVYADFYRQITGADSADALALDGTAIRLTFHPGPGGNGQYRFWTGRESYEEAHIPGAVHADILSFCDPDSPVPYTALDHERFSAAAGRLGIGARGTKVVLYDQGAGISFWASRLWWQLRLEGFDQVAVLEGGFRKWKNQGGTTDSNPVVLPPVTFDWTRRPALLADIAEVEKATDDPDVLIVDSLSPADFHGETGEYGGRGHIPSSVNVFCNSHTDPLTNDVLPESELRARLVPSGVLEHNGRVVVYCGGGMGATWNALVLHHLGRDDVAVFDGSMFEWTQDPTRRLVT